VQIWCFDVWLLSFIVVSFVGDKKKKATKSKSKKATEEVEEEEEEEEEDEDYEDEEEEEDDELSYDESEAGVPRKVVADAEEEDEDEEEEAKMPAKRKSKTPPRKAKAATPSKTATTSVDDLAGAVAGIGLEDAFSHSMNFVQPHMKFPHIEAGRKTINIELFVPALPNNFFRVRLLPCQQILHIQIKVPGIFVDKNRQTHALGGDDFNRNTHQNTAYSQCVDSVEETYDDGTSEGRRIDIWGAPMEFKLDFKCEEDIDWEVQFFPNDEGDLIDTLGGQQFFAVLVMKLTSVEKPKARNAGRVRVVTVPQAMEEEAADDDDDL